MCNHRLNEPYGIGLGFAAASLVLGFLASTVVAAPQKPTTITSGTMTAQGKSRKAIFEKSVVLTREDMVIRADRMTVFFKKAQHGKPEESSTKNSSGDSFGKQVDVVEALGSVIIEKADGNASSGRAVYYKDEDKVVLTESPKAWQNGTQVTGKRITIFLKEERSIVEGGAHVIIPEEAEGE